MSGLVSRECYMAWLEAKRASESDSEAAKFKRSLTNHVSGSVSLVCKQATLYINTAAHIQDGRVPFDPEEEEALLIFLRKKAPWPCYPKHLQYLGQRYRAMGHHEKLRGPTALKVVEQAVTATKEEDEDIVIHPQLIPLDMADAVYLTRLAEYIISTDQPHHPQVIHEVLRYMILGRTDCCSKPVPPLEYAQALHDQFLAANTAVMVLDMTSPSFKDCALCQNDMISGWRCEAMFQHDLMQSVLAIGAAYHRPGICFSSTRQQIACEDETIKLFDMNYYVDSESFFLVVFGKASVRL